jgi:hypothetical protein
MDYLRDRGLPDLASRNQTPSEDYYGWDDPDVNLTLTPSFSEDIQLQGQLDFSSVESGFDGFLPLRYPVLSSETGYPDCELAPPWCPIEAVCHSASHKVRDWETSYIYYQTPDPLNFSGSDYLSHISRNFSTESFEISSAASSLYLEPKAGPFREKSY